MGRTRGRRSKRDSINKIPSPVVLDLNCVRASVEEDLAC